MTRDEAEAEAERRREAEPAATWMVIERAGGWQGARIGLAPPIHRDGDQAAAVGAAVRSPPAP